MPTMSQLSTGWGGRTQLSETRGHLEVQLPVHGGQSWSLLGRPDGTERAGAVCLGQRARVQEQAKQRQTGRLAPRKGASCLASFPYSCLSL